MTIAPDGVVAAADADDDDDVADDGAFSVDIAESCFEFTFDLEPFADGGIMTFSPTASTSIPSYPGFRKMHDDSHTSSPSRAPLMAILSAFASSGMRLKYTTVASRIQTCILPCGAFASNLSALGAGRYPSPPKSLSLRTERRYSPCSDSAARLDACSRLTSSSTTTTLSFLSVLLPLLALFTRALTSGNANVTITIGLCR